MADSYNNRRGSEFIELTRRSKTYVDVSLSFVPSPVTNDITVLTNERAIQSAPFFKAS